MAFIVRLGAKKWVIMAVITIPWNKYEVTLLIDAYERIKDGRISRKEAISQLSLRLRAKVIAQGGVISEKYRNENGMDWQLSVIEYTINDGISGKFNPSKTFVDVANEYKEKYSNKILWRYPTIKNK